MRGRADRYCRGIRHTAVTLMLTSVTLAYEGVLDGDTLTLTHKVIEEGDPNDGQSLGRVLISARVLTATRKR